MKTVWAAKEWPGRTGGQDLGTDLVVEFVDGGLMAVQVKRRQRVTTAEIDSFLADTVDRFDERMLIATTDDIAAHGRTKLRQARAHVIARADLDASPVVWPTGGDLTTGRRLDRREARPHQAAAVADALAAMETHDRCRVVMACGSGKTLAAQRLAEAVAPDGLVVVAVPSLSLLAQTVASWARDSAVGFDDWLAVCSDPTVADAPDTSEMPSVTTDPADVTTWLQRDPTRGQQVVFVTHASMPVVADALTQNRRAAALLVVDEAHRVAGRGALARLATGVFPADKRVFLTATPRIYTAAAKSKADGEVVDVISMDDETRFGPEAHHLSFAHAVELGLLVDFEIVVSIITDSDVHRLVADRVIGELAGVEADTATLAAHVAVARALHEWDAKRTISFHTRIAQAHDFAAHHQALAHLVIPDETVIAESTSGKLPTGQRKAALDRLATLHGGADRRLLANARVLSEGVDVPAVDAVAFIDPRRSVIDIAQAVGRAMRTSPGKERGLVVVPVHLPDDYDVATATDDSVWKAVWDTLRALRSVDERLAERLDQYRFQLGRRASPTEAPTQLHFHSVEPLGVGFVEAVTLQAVRTTTAPWEEWFGRLVAYVEAHGTAQVLQDHVASDGHRLGQWVINQRSAYRVGRMSGERQARLEALVGWTWDTKQAAWEEGITSLDAYVEAHGTAQVPHRHVAGDGHRLGQWIVNQRSLRKQARMSEDRQARLEALPGWTWDAKAAAWEEGFAHLQTFVAEDGSSVEVPQSHTTSDGFRLGAWVSVQRSARKEGRLSAERQRRLEALPGWTWDTKATAWEEGFNRLEVFVDDHGTAQPLAKYVDGDGYRLGNWATKQRRDHRKGQLSTERQRRLEALPGWVWDPFEMRWVEGFERLRTFVDDHGTAQVPESHVAGDGFRIGQWVHVQRHDRTKGRLSKERQRRLEALPGWTWDTKATAWEEGFNRLEVFLDDHGTAQVPHAHVTSDGYRLGSWVIKQRSSHKDGRLSKDRQARLEALPGWTWDTKAAAWEEGFDRLEAFVDDHGTAVVPTGHVTGDGYRLGSWVIKQRSSHKDGRLSAERQARLEALPGWVWQARAAAWEVAIAHLEAYTAEVGTALVPQRHVTGDGFRLGAWVSKQRSARTQGTLSSDREARLESLPGWVWVRSEAVAR